MTNTETEVKIRVPDLKSVEGALKAAGATLKAERVYERNMRYENADNSLMPTGRVVRLRQDTRVRLTYKEPQDAALSQMGDAARPNVTSRTELEVTVSDYDTTDLILNKLGYHPAWLYEKYRTTYELHDAEVVLDEMPFGCFIEAEGNADAIEKALNAIHLQAAKRLEGSYSDWFFRIKERLGLTFNDLTFDNFKEVAVSDDLFQ